MVIKSMKGGGEKGSANRVPMVAYVRSQQASSISLHSDVIMCD